MRRSSRRRSNGSPTKKGVVVPHTVVDVCPEIDDEYGLFATRDIPKGAVITSMNRMRVAGTRLRNMYLSGRPGGDAAIHAGGELYTSSGFGPFRTGRYVKAPKWYRMNHSDRPNCKLVMDDGHLVWRTLRNVDKDEALTWHYGVRDPSWPRGAVSYCSHRRR